MATLLSLATANSIIFVSRSTTDLTVWYAGTPPREAAPSKEPPFQAVEQSTYPCPRAGKAPGRPRNPQATVDQSGSGARWSTTAGRTKPGMMFPPLAILLTTRGCIGCMRRGEGVFVRVWALPLWRGLYFAWWYPDAGYWGQGFDLWDWWVGRFLLTDSLRNSFFLCYWSWWDGGPGVYT